MAKPWPLSSQLSAEILPASAADGLRPHWDDLAGRTIEPNVFYGPATALAGLRHLPEGRGATLLVAWRGEGETRRLVGLLPLVRPRGRYFNPLPIRRAAAFYGTLSTPLLDPDRPADTLGAMLATLRSLGIKAVLLPFLSAEGPVAEALREAGVATDLPARQLDGHRRAMLRSRLSGAEYVRTTLEARRRKEVDRQRRRLADEGTIAFTVARDEADVAPALERFLDLEAAGWKGQAGTDLRSATGGEAFIRDAARAGARADAYRVATLALDGRPIAAGLVAIAGRRAFYTKTAYDETLARFSPGLLLTLDLTAHLLDDAAIDEADSIAIADHPMIDRIWTARFAVASTLVGTEPGGEPAFGLAGALERVREAAVVELKTRLAQVKRWRARSANAPARKGAPHAAA